VVVNTGQMLLNLVVQRKSRRRASLNTKQCFTSTSKLGKTSLRLSISTKVLFHIGNQLKRPRSALLGGTVDRLRSAFAVRTSFLWLLQDTCICVLYAGDLLLLT